MTQYLLAVHTDFEKAAATPVDEMQAAFEAVDAFNTQIEQSGALVFAGGLTPPETATVVRNHEGGEAVLVDGPFAETKEVLGGFWVVEVPDLDAALELAKQASAACRNPIEVRPFQGE